MPTAGSLCVRGTKGSENTLMKPPRPVCARYVSGVFAFSRLSHPICFHRNAGTDPRIGTRQGCLCDPDDVQVRWKTHIHTHTLSCTSVFVRTIHKCNTFSNTEFLNPLTLPVKWIHLASIYKVCKITHTQSWYICLCED